MQSSRPRSSIQSYPPLKLRQRTTTPPVSSAAAAAAAAPSQPLPRPQPTAKPVTSSAAAAASSSSSAPVNVNVREESDTVRIPVNIRYDLSLIAKDVWKLRNAIQRYCNGKQAPPPGIRGFALKSLDSMLAAQAGGIEDFLAMSSSDLDIDTEATECEEETKSATTASQSATQPVSFTVTLGSSSSAPTTTASASSNQRKRKHQTLANDLPCSHSNVHTTDDFVHCCMCGRRAFPNNPTTFFDPQEFSRLALMKNKSHASAAGAASVSATSASSVASTSKPFVRSAMTIEEIPD